MDYTGDALNHTIEEQGIMASLNPANKCHLYFSWPEVIDLFNAGSRYYKWFKDIRDETNGRTWQVNECDVFEILDISPTTRVCCVRVYNDTSPKGCNNTWCWLTGNRYLNWQQITETEFYFRRMGLLL